MHPESTNLTQTWTTKSRGKPLILRSKGEKSRSRGTKKNCFGVGFCTLVSAGFFSLQLTTVVVEQKKKWHYVDRFSHPKTRNLYYGRPL